MCVDNEERYVGQHREDWNGFEKTSILFVTISFTRFQIVSKTFHLSVPRFLCMLTCYTPH